MIVRACPVPQEALLQRYVGQGSGYTDCFAAHVRTSVSLEDFVTVFYTSALFRAERLVLSAVLRQRIFDGDITAVLNGHATRFAVWEVEGRKADQILMCDHWSATRSWFGVQPRDGGQTALAFGSAVICKKPTRPFMLRAILPAHRRYAAALLRAAAKRL